MGISHINAEEKTLRTRYVGCCVVFGAGLEAVLAYTGNQTQTVQADAR
jgi:hypothetical protein